MATGLSLKGIPIHDYVGIDVYVGIDRSITS